MLLGGAPFRLKAMQRRDPAESSSILTPLLQHGIRPGVERISALLARLGHPERRHPVVHVAGTNGKGSVCALLGSVLRAAGYRVGRFTSPHLVSYRERFYFDGAFISQDDLDAGLARVTAESAPLLAEFGPVTEFETLTAVGFDWFARQPMDVLLLEVGLGGRLDATNVVARPAVSVVTRIARDHTQLLGESLTEIAREKAGILKPGVPAVTGADGDALDEIESRAAAVGAPLVRARDARWLGPGETGDLIEIAGARFEIGLSGAHQAQNAAIALETLERLRAQGWTIPDEAVRDGFRAARWPGRMDRWTSASGQRYLVDGAHNLDGVEALVRALHDRPDPRGRVIVMGVLADKEPEPMMRALARAAATLVLTTAPSTRAMDPRALAARLEHPDVRIEPDWKEALLLAERLAQGREIVVAGSLYLVGAAYEALGRSVEA